MKNFTKYENLLMLALTPSDTEVGVSNITAYVDNNLVAEDIFSTNVTLVPSEFDNQTLSGNVVMSPRSSSPIWLIPCYCIILLCAVVGNLLVISTLAQNRRMRTITNVFLLNLAISDILLGVFCMPVTLVGTILRHFIFGEFLCKFISFSQAISVAVSSWTLVAISCERYYAICHPLRSRTWQTISHAYKIIAFIWIGSIVCMTPIAIFSQLIPTSRQGLRKCREYWPGNSIGYERSYNIFLDLLLFILPLLILCVAYILITHTLFVGMQKERALIFGGSTPIINNSNNINNNNSSKSKRRHKAYQQQQLHQLQHKQQQQQPQQELEDVERIQDPDNLGVNLSRPNNFKPSSLVNVRTVSNKRNGINTSSSSYSLNGNNVGSSISDDEPEIIEALQQRTQSQPLDLQQRSKRFDKSKPIHANVCYDEKYYGSKAGGKRMLLTTPTGRSHLYCMRTSSFNMPTSVRHYKQKDGFNTATNATTTFTTTSIASMTVINMPQQQCFQLQQQRQQQQQQQIHKLQFNNEQKERKKCTTTSSLRLPDTTLRRSNEAKTLESKRRVIKMLFVLVLEFFICWTPLYVINTFAVFIGSTMYEYIDYSSISFFQLLAYSSSCCNPITYCFMNAGFRRAFLDTFKGLHFRWDGHFCFRRHKNEHSLSMAGNSITLANSVTMSNNTLLDSPRL